MTTIDQTRQSSTPQMPTSTPPMATPPSIALSDLNKMVEKELQSPEVQKKLHEFTRQAMEELANERAVNTKVGGNTVSPRGAAGSASLRHQESQSPQTKRANLEQAKNQISEKKTNLLLQDLIKHANPPLTEAQAQTLQKAVASFPEKVQQMWVNGAQAEQVKANLLKLARSGQLERLEGKLEGSTQDKNLKKMAFSMMLARPEKAKELTDAALNVRVRHLASSYGTLGPQLQMSALVLAADGHNLSTLLSNKDFYRANAQTKLACMQMIATEKVPLSEVSNLCKAKEKLEALMEKFQSSGLSRADKTAFLTQISAVLQDQPKSFRLLGPQAKQALAGVLVARVGFGGGKGVDSESAFSGLAALKKDNPAEYKKIFGPLMEKAKLGPAAFSSYLEANAKGLALPDAISSGVGSGVEKIMEHFMKTAKVAGGVGTAAGLGLGVALAIANGKDGVESMTNAVTAFATGGIGAAIASTMTLGAGASFVVGAAPAVLVALWSSFCERGVAEQQMKDTVKQMQDDQIKP